MATKAQVLAAITQLVTATDIVKTDTASKIATEATEAAAHLVELDELATAIQAVVV